MTEKLHIAFELSKSNWKLGFGTGNRYRESGIKSGDIPALLMAISRAKQKFALPDNCKIVSCYEAGRDGFWIHRLLLKHGIKNLIIDSASIEVSRKSKNAKTDKIDTKKLYRLLLRYHGGESDVFRIVHVPTERDEDLRRRNREIDRIKNERKAHRVRIQALLALHGINKRPMWSKFEQEVDDLTQWNGKSMPTHLKNELLREYQRLKIIDIQLKKLTKVRIERINNPKTKNDQLVKKLYELKAIGECTSNILVDEFFGWRNFKNVREVGACAGLTGTPYNSGESVREQGISKSGNSRIRSLMTEIAWGWLRLQPESALTKWYQDRFASGGARMRKVGIVALSRKLLVALWKYIEKDELPDGALLKVEAA